MSLLTHLAFLLHQGLEGRAVAGLVVRRRGPT